MVTAVDERARKPDGHSPVRTCAVTRQEAPVDDLIRFAAGPDGTIVPDLAGKLPGRGVWVLCARSVVEKAAKSGAFARSLKRQVQVQPDLADLVEALMLKRVLAALSLANKAGLVLTGFTKVETAIAAGTAGALVQAADGSDDGVEKLGRRYLAMCRDAGRTPHIERTFGIEQISLALGRANVVHAALMTGGAAQNFLSEAGRLKRFRTGRLDVEQAAAADIELPAGQAGMKSDQE
jgi:uncharacterized protein